MNIHLKPIEKTATERKWALCPYCKAKTVIYDDCADCKGVFVKCTRGCRNEFELIIEDGRQVLPPNPKH